MSKYINAEEHRKEMSGELKDLLMLIEIYNPDHKPISIEALRALVERLPLDTNTRKATWEKTGRVNPVDGSAEYKCSFCGGLYSMRHTYCPKCGSYMPKIV